MVLLPWCYCSRSANSKVEVNHSTYACYICSCTTVQRKWKVESGMRVDLFQLHTFVKMAVADTQLDDKRERDRH